MKVKDLMKQEERKYDCVMVVDVRNIPFPHKYEDYDVITHKIELVDSYSLTTGKKHTRKRLYITCKKVN